MNDKYYLNEALKEARKAFNKGEVPVGAVVVLNNKILSRGYNLREKKKDITKHAELIAIKKASKIIKDWRLEKCVLYVTLLPCPMCASAIVQSRIEKIVVGTSTLDISNKDIVYKIFEGNNTSPKVQVIDGVQEVECRELLRIFFEKKRKK